jgi:hypothetical protein
MSEIGERIRLSRHTWKLLGVEHDKLPMMTAATGHEQRSTHLGSIRKRTDAIAYGAESCITRHSHSQTQLRLEEETLDCREPFAPGTPCQIGMARHRNQIGKSTFPGAVNQLARKLVVRTPWEIDRVGARECLQPQP